MILWYHQRAWVTWSIYIWCLFITVFHAAVCNSCSDVVPFWKTLPLNVEEYSLSYIYIANLILCESSDEINVWPHFAINFPTLKEKSNRTKITRVKNPAIPPPPHPQKWHVVTVNALLLSFENERLYAQTGIKPHLSWLYIT